MGGGANVKIMIINVTVFDRISSLFSQEVYLVGVWG